MLKRPVTVAVSSAIISVSALAINLVFAQTPPLSTQGVGVDRNGICWVQGPANVLRECHGIPALGTPVAITSATQVLPAGNWLIVSGGTATVVISDGTAVTGVATGNAYPV